MPLANEHTPFYLFSETCVDNSVSRNNVQWHLSPAFLVLLLLLLLLLLLFFMGRWNFKNTDPLVFWLSWHAAPKYWPVCSRHRLIYLVSVMAANFNVTWRPEFPSNSIFARDWTVPETLLERLCFAIHAVQSARSHRVTQRKQWF